MDELAYIDYCYNININDIYAPWYASAIERAPELLECAPQANATMLFVRIVAAIILTVAFQHVSQTQFVRALEKRFVRAQAAIRSIRCAHAYVRAQVAGIAGVVARLRCIGNDFHSTDFRIASHFFRRRAVR